MKKLFYFVALLLGGLCVGCSLDNDDSHCSAEVNYFALCDSMVFADSADVVFAGAIDSSLQKIGVLSGKNVNILFTKYAEVKSPYVEDAFKACAAMADTAYRSMLEPVSKEKILMQMVVSDIKTPLPLDSLDDFNVHYNLMYMTAQYALPISVGRYVGKY